MKNVPLANLHFLFAEFFCPHKNDWIRDIYTEFHNLSAADSETLSASNKAMQYRSLRRKRDKPEKTARFKFSRKRHRAAPDHKIFLRYVEIILEHYVKKPKEGEKGYVDLAETELDIYCLRTRIGCLQVLHMDMSHTCHCH